MQGNLRAVLFDLGGTLIKTAPIPEILRRILEAHNIRRSAVDIEYAQRRADEELKIDDYRLPYEEFWRKWNLKILKTLNVKGDVDLLASIITREWWSYADVELYPDTEETLNSLRELDFKLGIISNGFEKDIEIVLDITGLGGFFSVKVGADTIKKPKPNREIFLFATEKLNVKPEEAVFVGDMLEIDYYGARNAGLNAVLIDRENNINVNVKKIVSLTDLLHLLIRNS